MPPKAAGRGRTTRVASREPDSTPAPQSGFQKPNLPPLQGTPSSRRQYAYGAAAEPVPSRPGRGLQRGQVLDLSTAVRSALVRHDEEEEHDGGPARARVLEQSVDPDEDELAGASETASHGPRDVIRGVFNLGQGTEGSEADDARSFDMESDYYVDATINSTPGSMPPPSTRRRAAKADTVSASPKTRASNRSPRKTRRLLDLAEEEDSAELDAEAQAAVSTTRANRSRATKPASEKQAEGSQPVRQRGRGAQEREAEATESEEDTTVKPIRLRTDVDTNTFAPRRGQVGTSGKSQTRTTRAAPASPPESEGRTLQGSTSAVSEKPAPIRRRGRPAAGKQPAGASSTRRGGLQEEDESGSESGRWITGATRATTTGGRFANAPLLQPSATKHRTAPQRDSARQERDDETEDELDAPRNRWAWLRSLVPAALRRRAQDYEIEGDEEDVDEDEDEEHAPAINWWHLLNPWTYIKATAWLALAIWDRLAGFFTSLFPARMPELMRRALWELPYVIAGILSLILALVLVSAAYNHSGNAAADDLWDPAPRGSSWPALGDITGKIGGYLPTISWPSSSRGDDDITWEMDGATRATCDDYLQKTKQAFQSLEKTGRLHDGALKRLEAVLPKVVHMQLKDGRPVVAAEFYHALRDLIHEDDSVLTFAEEGSEYDVVGSERQWKAIAARLIKDTTFTSKLNSTVGEAEERLGERVTGFWHTWVKQNEAKIQQAIGSAVEQINSAGSQREFDERLGAIVREQLRDGEQRGLVVSRDEFLRHLDGDVAALRGEIRAELQELRPRLEKLVRESVALAQRDDAPPGMSRAEVTSLVDGLVRRAFADVNLEAVARGQIHAHWDAELKHQVNYFSVGAGATVDARHSSATYDAFKQHPRRFPYYSYSSDAARDRASAGLRRPLPPLAALAPWADVGDCWCAARAVNRRGNPHGAALSVQLAHRVVPQHLVLEHILPGATPDPGARPRHVEVYAVIPDEAVRARVRDFAAVTYPAPSDPADDWNRTPADLPPHFVLVSRFVYEGAELHDGVHVHRLSSELVAMGADTDQVVVRATSNYGAPDHTCFYRVRLYGHNVETEEREGGLDGTQWQ